MSNRQTLLGDFFTELIVKQDKIKEKIKDFKKRVLEEYEPFLPEDHSKSYPMGSTGAVMVVELEKKIRFVKPKPAKTKK